MDDKRSGYRRLDYQVPLGYGCLVVFKTLYEVFSEFPNILQMIQC